MDDHRDTPLNRAGLARGGSSLNGSQGVAVLAEYAYAGTADYIAAPELMQTVNVAIALARPLLIKGEPGTGKTMLAQSIARGLGMPLITWTIKSTTKAQEGLYVYDTVQRLYDGQFGDRDVSDIKQYIKLGKLGQAFTSPERVVLLIDEIDKADIEFPNDLLWELDQMEFFIPETRETVTAKQRPVVVITSNAEKELPDAFLRRCIFHYIEFPDEEMMRRIVLVHHPHLDERLLTWQWRPSTGCATSLACRRSRRRASSSIGSRRWRWAASTPTRSRNVSRS